MPHKSNLIGTLFFSVTLFAISLGMSGCNSAMPSVAKAENKAQPQAQSAQQGLDVQTHLSEAVKLKPVAAAKKVVYLDIRNMSRKNVEVAEQVKKAFASKGYKVTGDPRNATYMFQSNILKIGKSDLNEAKGYLKAGYGGGVTGAADEKHANDPFYVMVTDLQIRERPESGEGKWNTYRTRIVSTTDNGDEDFEEARPALQSVLAQSMSGMF